jgi:hypothetical protein
LLQQKHPENDDGIRNSSLSFHLQSQVHFWLVMLPDFDYLVDERQTSGVTDYLHSPMSDGTIEEDFEEALAREIEANSILDDISSPSKLFCAWL